MVKQYLLGGRPKSRFAPVFTFAADCEMISMEQQRLQKLHNEMDAEGFGGTVQVSLSRNGEFVSTVVYSEKEMEYVRQSYLGLFQDLHDALLQSWERGCHLMRRQCPVEENKNNKNADPAFLWRSISPRRPHDINVIRSGFEKLHFRFGYKLFQTKRADGETMLTNLDLHRSAWSLMLSYLSNLTLPTLIELIETFVFYRVDEGRIMELLVPEADDDKIKSILSADGSGLFQLVQFLQGPVPAGPLEETETMGQGQPPFKRRRTADGDVPSSIRSTLQTTTSSDPSSLPLSLQMLFVHLVDREQASIISNPIVSKDDLDKRLREFRFQNRSCLHPGELEDALRLYFLERMLLNPEQSPLSLQETQDLVLSYQQSALNALTKASALPFLVVNTRIIQMIFSRNEIHGAQTVACRFLDRESSLYYNARELKSIQPYISSLSSRKRASSRSVPSPPVFISETLQEQLFDPAYPLYIWLEVKLSFPHCLAECVMMTTDVSECHNVTEDQRIKLLSKIFHSFMCTNQLFDLDFTFMESNPLYIFVVHSSFYALQLFCKIYVGLLAELDDKKRKISKEEYSYLASATEETVCYLLHSKFPLPESFQRYELLFSKSRDRFSRSCENLKRTENSAGPSAQPPNNAFPLIGHPREKRSVVDFLPIFRKVGLLDEDKEPLSAPVPRNLFSATFDFARAADYGERDENDVQEVETDAKCWAEAGEGATVEGSEENPEREDYNHANLGQSGEESEQPESDVMEVEDEDDDQDKFEDSEGRKSEEEDNEIEEEVKSSGNSGQEDEREQDSHSGEVEEVIAEVASNDDSDGRDYEDPSQEDPSTEGNEHRAQELNEKCLSPSRSSEMETEVESPSHECVAEQYEDVNEEEESMGYASPLEETNETASEQSPVSPPRKEAGNSEDEMEETFPAHESSEGVPAVRAPIVETLGSQEDEAENNKSVSKAADTAEGVGVSHSVDDMGVNQPAPSALERVCSNKTSQDKALPGAPATQDSRSESCHMDGEGYESNDLSDPRAEPESGLSADEIIESSAKHSSSTSSRLDEMMFPGAAGKNAVEAIVEDGDVAMVDVDAGYEAAEEDHYNVSRSLSGEMPAYDSASQEDATSLVASQSVENACLRNLDRSKEVNLTAERTALIQKEDDQGYDATAEDSQGHTEEEEDRPNDTLGAIDADTERSSVLEELQGQNEQAEELIDGYDATAEESQGHNSEEEEERPNPLMEQADGEPEKSSTRDDSGDKSTQGMLLPLATQSSLPDAAADGYEATAEESQGHTEEEEERLNEMVRSAVSGVERSNTTEDKPPSIRDGYDAAAEDESQEHTEEEEVQPSESTKTIHSGDFPVYPHPEPREKTQRHVAFENVDEGYMPDDAHTEDERPVKRKKADGYQGGDSSMCQTEDEGVPTDNEEEGANLQSLSIQQTPSIQQAGVPQDAQSLSGMSAADERTAGKQDDDESSELEDVDGDCQEPIPPLAGGSSLQDFATAAQHAVGPQKLQKYTIPTRLSAPCLQEKGKLPSRGTSSAKSSQTISLVIENPGDGDIQGDFEEKIATCNIPDKKDARAASSLLLEAFIPQVATMNMDYTDQPNDQSPVLEDKTKPFEGLDATVKEAESIGMIKSGQIGEDLMDVEQSLFGSYDHYSELNEETAEVKNVHKDIKERTSGNEQENGSKMEVEEGSGVEETREVENLLVLPGEKSENMRIGEAKMKAEEISPEVCNIEPCLTGPVGVSMEIGNGQSEMDQAVLFLTPKFVETSDVVTSAAGTEASVQSPESFGEARKVVDAPVVETGSFSDGKSAGILDVVMSAEGASTVETFSVLEAKCAGALDTPVSETVSVLQAKSAGNVDVAISGEGVPAVETVSMSEAKSGLGVDIIMLAEGADATIPSETSVEGLRRIDNSPIDEAASSTLDQSATEEAVYVSVKNTVLDGDPVEEIVTSSQRMLPVIPEEGALSASVMLKTSAGSTQKPLKIDSLGKESHEKPNRKKSGQSFNEFVAEGTESKLGMPRKEHAESSGDEFTADSRGTRRSARLTTRSDAGDGSDISTQSERKRQPKGHAKGTTEGTGSKDQIQKREHAESSGDEHTVDSTGARKSARVATRSNVPLSGRRLTEVKDASSSAKRTSTRTRRSNAEENSAEPPKGTRLTGRPAQESELPSGRRQTRQSAKNQVGNAIDESTTLEESEEKIISSSGNRASTRTRRSNAEDASAESSNATKPTRKTTRKRQK